MRCVITHFFFLNRLPNLQCMKMCCYFVVLLDVLRARLKVLYHFQVDHHFFRVQALEVSYCNHLAIVYFEVGCSLWDVTKQRM